MCKNASILHFKVAYNEIKPIRGRIEELLGLNNSEGPFTSIIDEVIALSSDLKNICASLTVYNNIDISPKNGTIWVENIQFNTGPVIAKNLQGVQKIAVFVCTAGPELEKWAKTQSNMGNIAEAYVADLAGSLIVEGAMDLVSEKFLAQMQLENMNITNRYSPGYCGWEISAQKDLFSLLPKGACNVSLSEYLLMNPVKSVSGFLGAGVTVKKKPYACADCKRVFCTFKK